MLLLIPLDRPLKRLNPWLGLAFSFLLFILLRDVAAGYIAFPGLFRLEMPSAIYGPKLLTPLGLPHPGFRSSDYFPMLPWFFLYLCGYFLNGIFNALPWLRRPFTRSIPVLSSLGRRALPIYLLHQPLCMLVCIIIFDFLCSVFCKFNICPWQHLIYIAIWSLIRADIWHKPRGSKKIFKI